MSVIVGGAADPGISKEMVTDTVSVTVLQVVSGTDRVGARAVVLFR
jgi:hypothetical protein